MHRRALMRYSHLFLSVIPRYKAGYPRVTHPSATNLRIARLHRKSVRLACVKHAASVHPEPGSNSHVEVLSLVRRTLALPFADRSAVLLSHISVLSGLSISRPFYEILF